MDVSLAEASSIEDLVNTTLLDELQLIVPEWHNGPESIDFSLLESSIVEDEPMFEVLDAKDEQ